MITKIFCDIADLNLIKKFNKQKIVKGFTTNPSLMRKAGAKDYESYSKKLLKNLQKKTNFFEVFADDHNSMIKQGTKNKYLGKKYLCKSSSYKFKKKIYWKSYKKIK